MKKIRRRKEHESYEALCIATAKAIATLNERAYNTDKRLRDIEANAHTNSLEIRRERMERKESMENLIKYCGEAVRKNRAFMDEYARREPVKHKQWRDGLERLADEIDGVHAKTICALVISIVSIVTVVILWWTMIKGNI